MTSSCFLRQACNTAGLFGAALQLFDKLYAITDPASESERSGIDFDYESEAGFDSDISESDSPSDDSSTEQSTNVEDGSDAGGGIMGEDSWAGFEELHDVPDGELIPAAAAAIALESCFLGGNRSRAMEIVWQVNFTKGMYWVLGSKKFGSLNVSCKVEKSKTVIKPGRTVAR